MNPQRLVPFILLILLFPEAGYPFQSHPAPEGLYAHQIAHVLFIAAMAMLAYWLKEDRLTELKGWRLIQVSCLLFIAWNLVAMVGHWVEERVPDTSLIGEPDWTQRIVLSSSPWVEAYYVLKMDHLVCVPALLCLFLGIRSLYREAVSRERRNDG